MKNNFVTMISKYDFHDRKKKKRKKQKIKNENKNKKIEKKKYTNKEM